MYCQVCEREVQPVIDITESGKPLPICGKCQAPLGTSESLTGPTPASRSADLPNVHEQDPPRAKGGVVSGPQDLVGAAKARLQVIDRELERLAGLQRERRRLAAMIAAADAADEEDVAALAVRRALNGSNDEPLTAE